MTQNLYVITWSNEYHLGAQCTQCVIPYGGERCDMLAACDGNLCHNGGACTTTAQADSQLGLIDINNRFDNLQKVYTAIK